MWAPAPARPTPPSSTPASTPPPAPPRPGWWRAGTNCCATTRPRPASRWSPPAPCSWPGTTNRRRACRGCAEKAAVNGYLHTEVIDGDGGARAGAAPRRRSHRRHARTARVHHRPVVHAHRVRHRSSGQRHANWSPASRSRGWHHDGDTTVLAAADGRQARTRFVVNAAGLYGDELHRLMGFDGFTVRPAPRRTHRVRQAGPSAVAAHPAAGAHQPHQGRAGGAHRVRQRDARPHRRRHRRQDRHGIHPGRDRRSAREGPSHPAGAAPGGGHGGVRRAACGHRAQRLPAQRPRRRPLCLPGRHPVHRPHLVDGARRGGPRAAHAMPASPPPNGRSTNCAPSVSPRSARSTSAPTSAAVRRSATANGSPPTRSSRRARPWCLPDDLDGLRRRTRVLAGRCQGFYCSAEVCALAARTDGRTMQHWMGAT